MRGYDDVVQVGFAQQRLEERVGVADACLGNNVIVCDEAIAPAHGHSKLPAALNKKQCCGADLHRSRMYLSGMA